VSASKPSDLPTSQLQANIESITDQRFSTAATWIKKKSDYQPASPLESPKHSNPTKSHQKHNMSLSARTATISRSTNETKIQISLSLDGGVLPPYEPSTHFPAPTDPQEAEAAKKGIVPPKDAGHATQFTPTQQITISTGIGFLDHMLHALAKHGGMSLAVRAKGDLYSKSTTHFPPFSLYNAKTQNQTNMLSKSTTTTQQKTPSSPSAKPSPKPSAPANPSSASAAATHL
jgi:hypothetical protein